MALVAAARGNLLNKPAQPFVDPYQRRAGQAAVKTKPNEAERSMVCLRGILALCLLVEVGIAAFAQAVVPDVPSLAPMLERVLPGVVSIASHGHAPNEQDPLLSDPYVRKFFGLPEDADPGQHEFWTAGSGVIVDAGQGYVLTSGHVVEGADDITVVLVDGRRLAASALGVDEYVDLALIQIRPNGLVAPTLGDSDLLRVGDYVVAVGNPFALGQTVTLGIVSGLRRTGPGVREEQDYIQTDALINPGNSGGALVNLRGEVIGINNFVFSPSGSSSGIGFAIPINVAREVMRELIRRRKPAGELGNFKNGVGATSARGKEVPLAAKRGPGSRATSQ